MSLITITEADDILLCPLYPTWEELTPKEKLRHIDIASTFIAVRWDCADIDWTDSATLTTAVKEAVALYAYESSQGTLYSSGEDGGVSVSPIKKKTIKAGPLEKTVEYAQPDVASSRIRLQYIEDKLRLTGCAMVYSANSLRRV